MTMFFLYLPGTGRGTSEAGGGAVLGDTARDCPSTTRVENASGPPPRAGEV